MARRPRFVVNLALSFLVCGALAAVDNVADSPLECPGATAAASFLGAIRAGINCAQDARAAGNASVIVVVRLSASPSGSALPWDEAAGADLNLNATTVRVEGGGAIVECTSREISDSLALSVTRGTLLISNVTVRGCHAAPLSRGTDFALAPSLLLLDVGGTSAWTDFAVHNFTGVRFARAAGALTLVGGKFSLMANASGAAAIAYVYSTGKCDVRNTAISAVSYGVSLGALEGGLFAVRDSASFSATSLAVQSVALPGGSGAFFAASGTASVHIRGVNASNVGAQAGGLIFVSGSAVVDIDGLDARVFSALYSGGAVMASTSATLSMQRCTFVGGYSGSAGGVVYATDDATLQWNSSTVLGTFASTLGGAIAIANKGGSVIIDGVQFVNCSSAGFAGLLAAYSPETTVVRLSRIVAIGSFSNNGGSFYIDGSTVITIAASSFTRTTAMFYGGFILAHGSCVVNVEDTVIEGSSAGASGAVVHSPGAPAMFFRRCVIRNARALTDAGLLALTSAARAQFVDTEISDFSVVGNGAVGWMDAFSVLSFQNCSIAACSAALSGGLVHATGLSTTIIAASRVWNISAGASGGLASVHGHASVHLVGTSIRNCIAGRVSALGASSSGIDSDRYFDSLVASNGGVVFAESNANVTMTMCTADVVEASGGGGLIAATGGASVSLAYSDVTRARAYVGGVSFVGLGATLVMSQVSVTEAAADADGGCVYLGRLARATFNGVALSRCSAGVVRSTFGAGGALYVGANVTLSIPAPLIARNVSAVFGAGIYTGVLIDEATRRNAVIESVVPINKTELPSDWEGGGDLVGAVGELHPSIASALVQSGGTIPPFALEIHDIYNGRVSLPADHSLALRLRIEPADAATAAISAVGPAPLVVGDLEKNFATAAAVAFSGLRVFAWAGKYVLRADSRNPFLYGALDPNTDRRNLLRHFSLPVTVGDCASGLPVSGPIDGDASRTGWQCVAQVDAGSGNSKVLVRGVVPAVVGCLALVAGLAVFVRWRWVVHRRQQSRMAQAEFVQKQGDRLRELAALEIARTHVELMERLGEGEFGFVLRARIVVDERPRICAAKMLKEGATFAERDACVSEAELLLGKSHPNVISLVGVVSMEDPMLLLFEYAPYGDLRSFVTGIPAGRRTASVTHTMLASFAVQTAHGMAYLASVGVIHRDLAARNVLLSQDIYGEYVVKIADFGLSRERALFSEYYRSKRGKKERLPFRWIAIEVWNDRKFTEKTDVWAYGVTLWELYAFGMTPYTGMNYGDVLSHIRAGNRLDAPQDGWPPAVQSIAEACWQADPDLRPTFAEIVQLLSAVPAAAAASKRFTRQVSDGVATSPRGGDDPGGYVNVLSSPPVRRVVSGEGPAAFAKRLSIAVNGKGDEPATCAVEMQEVRLDTGNT